MEDQEFLKVEEILEHAAKIVERGWTQNRMAAFGYRDVDPVDPKAEAWCALGSIERAVYELSEGKLHPTKDADGVSMAHVATASVRDLLPGTSLSWFNDRSGRTQEEISQLLRKAAHS